MQADHPHKNAAIKENMADKISNIISIFEFYSKSKNVEHSHP